jgi:hypothetical protein
MFHAAAQIAVAILAAAITTSVALTQSTLDVLTARDLRE